MVGGTINTRTSLRATEAETDIVGHVMGTGASFGFTLWVLGSLDVEGLPLGGRGFLQLYSCSQPYFPLNCFNYFDT